MAQQMGNSFREDFDGPGVDPSMWTVTQPGGSAMTAAVANQVLTIHGGVQANDSLALTSAATYSLPGRVKFTCSVSQRIANQTITLRVRNAAGDTIAAWILDGTVATTGKISATRKGLQATVDTAATLAAASSTMLDYELDARVESVDYGTRAADGSGASTNAGSRTRTIPVADGYLVEIVVANGGVAPASDTVVTVESIYYQDTSRVTGVEVVAGRGMSSPARSLPVTVTGGAGTISTSAGTNRMGFVGAAGIWYDDSVVALAAAATFTGVTRDLALAATGVTFASASSMGMEYRTSAESDQAFTLALEVSRDNVNWRRVKAVASAAVTGGGQYAEIVHRPSWRYARTVVVNGATLMGRLAVGTYTMAN